MPARWRHGCTGMPPWLRRCRCVDRCALLPPQDHFSEFIQRDLPARRGVVTLSAPQVDAVGVCGVTGLRQAAARTPMWRAPRAPPPCAPPPPWPPCQRARARCSGRTRGAECAALSSRARKEFLRRTQKDQAEGKQRTMCAQTPVASRALSSVPALRRRTAAEESPESGSALSRKTAPPRLSAHAQTPCHDMNREEKSGCIRTRRLSTSDARLTCTAPSSHTALYPRSTSVRSELLPCSRGDTGKHSGKHT
jgi:hypothetical protein